MLPTFTQYICVNPGSGKGVGVGMLEFSQCHNSRLTGEEIKLAWRGGNKSNFIDIWQKMFTYVICVLLRSPVFPRRPGLVQNATSIKVSTLFFLMPFNTEMNNICVTHLERECCWDIKPSGKTNTETGARTPAGGSKGVFIPDLSLSGGIKEIWKRGGAETANQPEAP